MTDYETQSLEVAKNTLYVYGGADLIALLALIAVIWGGWTALKTLKTITQQLENAKWNALLSFEEDMNNRRQRLSDIAAEVIPDSKDKHCVRIEEAKESYLNTVERLASAILKGQFPEDEMKRSYREFMISTTRDSEFKEKIGDTTRYRGIKELNDKWKD